jgi:5'-nucleotidase
MNILLTNDDGIYAEGLWAMKKALARQHRVFVVAPDKERSAIGHSITLLDPLRISEITTNGDSGYAVNGTPADCVKLAVQEILQQRPDLVVSGINPGANVGINLNYSGTVSAAKEAALLGLPAIAVSQAWSCGNDYRLAAGFIVSLVDQIRKRGLPKATFLNVNIPLCEPDKIEGVCITRQGIVQPKETFHKRIDPRNQPYYWQGIDAQIIDDSVDTDRGALCRNCISITPVQCDMTDYETMKQLKDWDFCWK